MAVIRLKALGETTVARDLLIPMLIAAAADQLGGKELGYVEQIMCDLQVVDAEIAFERHGSVCVWLGVARTLGPSATDGQPGSFRAIS